VKIAVGLLNEDGFPREGQVDFTDNELNTGTGTLQLRAILPNPDRSLRVGLYARARLSLDQPRDTLLVPERAVGIDQGQRFVYVVGPENKVEYRKVTVGQIYDGKLAIRDGIKPEDRIIIEGLQMLRPGQVVEIAAPDKSAAAKPASESHS
jgi:multidrug efflux system membrane fusion protein